MPAALACAISGGALFTAKVGTAVVEDIQSGRPERIPGDIVFNSAGELLGKIPIVGPALKRVWTTGCGFSKWCSGPHLSNPFEE